MKIIINYLIVGKKYIFVKYMYVYKYESTVLNIDVYINKGSGELVSRNRNVTLKLG